ncbi:helix-turn-helix transcriptional regulator [Streptomyces sp. ODS28]|uniref:helix-turn-helix transcriptional regulator n=1 Tax=Streptomyces sp. ODS28 TaxID=3136688 RepID=UPI0031E6B90E
MSATVPETSTVSEAPTVSETLPAPETSADSKAAADPETSAVSEVPAASSFSSLADITASFADARGDEAARRRELAAFLRSRRERTTPERVGLPRGQRRRTPGLRREEVAHLSTVGVTWYTWLEQGRDIRVSAQVLDALARALLMDRGERAHLFALAGTPDPLPGADCPGVSDSALRLLRQMAPLPAAVQNARYDVLASNRPYAEVFGDPEELPFEERNCLWLLLKSERWRETFLDRDEMLRDLVAKFRGAMAEHMGDPVWCAWLRRLEGASEEFRELWEAYEVAPVSPHVKRYRHARAGLLRLEHRNMWMTPQVGAPRVVAYVPADDETERRLEWLGEQA